MQPALNSVTTLAKLQFPHKKRIFFFPQVDSQESLNDEYTLQLVLEFGEWIHFTFIGPCIILIVE